MVTRVCERCGRPTGKYEFFRDGEQRHWVHYRCMDRGSDSESLQRGLRRGGQPETSLSRPTGFEP
jgi:hypothetical protein